MTGIQPAKKTASDQNLPRAALKTAVILLVLLVIAGLIALFIDDSLIDTLKFNLSLGALIGLVVVINIISLICFMMLYAAYQWVRRDLKSSRNADIEDDPKD